MEILGSGSTQTDAAFGVRGDVVVPDNRDAFPRFRWLDDFDHADKKVGNPTLVNINFYQDRPVAKTRHTAQSAAFTSVNSAKTWPMKTLTSTRKGRRTSSSLTQTVPRWNFLCG